MSDLENSSPYKPGKKQQGKIKKHPYVKEDPLPTEETRIKESFRWLTDSFKTKDASKNTIKIKGVALRSDTVSQNQRKYVEEELVKSARTLIGKPITINHDPKIVVGNVDWAEFENGALEYLATIRRKPYVGMLRDKSAEIRGVSVEANYLHNKCLQCGERFETEDGFRSHMEEAHFIKSGITAPHGINYSALSLVLSPETPGVKDTSIELFETAPGVNKLFETIVSEKGLKLAEPTDEHGCEPDEHYVEGKGCVPNEVATEQDVSAEPVEPKKCGPTELLNPDTNECEPVDITKVGEMMRNLDETFVKGTKAQLKFKYQYVIAGADKLLNKLKEQHKEDLASLVTIALHHDERLKALEAQPKQPVLTESTDNLKGFDKRLIEVENKLTHIKPFFKGHQKPIKETSEGESDLIDSSPYKATKGADKK